MSKPQTDHAKRLECAAFRRFLCPGGRMNPVTAGCGALQTLRAGISVVFLLLLCITAHTQQQPVPDFSTREIVGRYGPNRAYTPANQILTPVGLQVELPGLRPQALALSPDGRLLITTGKNSNLTVIASQSGKILQRVALPSKVDHHPAPGPVSDQILHPDKENQVSFTGLVFSPDGSRIYLANVDGSIEVFSVAKSGKVAPLFTLPLPPAHAPRREAEIPSGLAVSPDGKKLYVVLNLSNRLAELDAENGQVLRIWDVGVAPYDVVLAGTKAYVSNWGGRRPEPGNVTGPAGRGTLVRVDPVRYIANEGSVSVIDLVGKTGQQSSSNDFQEALVPGSSRPGEGQPPVGTPHAGAAGNPVREIITGLHPCALVFSPNRRWLVVANAASDTLSVIDTRTDTIVETICVRQNPADLFGAQPNALAFDQSGRTLFVCNATQNALAVVTFTPGSSKLLGLIPVGWFPAALVFDHRTDRLYVANLKGLSPGRPRKDGRPEFNSHQYHGSLSLLNVPSPRELGAWTTRALANMRYPLLAQAALPPRPAQPPRPVPERVGEPSVFKHVVYIIKENRTYDQVLGDLKEGNGDASLCVFGERVTPNQHNLAREFVLLDNTYCSGILSADGHQWTDTGITTEYAERSFAGFPRSYVDGMGVDEVDALAYSPAGFLWDNALAHGKTLRDYGEFALTETRWKTPSQKAPDFLDFYRDIISRKDAIEIYSRPGIESLRPFLVTNTAGWDLDIPDMFRASQFIKELNQFEKTGTYPNLTLVCLPNDHTSGTKAHSPTPAAQVADNDLALGRILEALSHGRFWPETCVFCIEDDPQSGWDHVSAYRTTAYVMSPYTRRHAVISTQYNQTSVLRTIELILGLPPMHQLDATATPMADCFTHQLDLTPFIAVPNLVPLDQMNPEKISDPLLRKEALASARLPLAKPDQCPEALLNRILWHALKGPSSAYPVWASRMEKDPD